MVMNLDIWESSKLIGSSWKLNLISEVQLFHIPLFKVWKYFKWFKHTGFSRMPNTSMILMALLHSSHLDKVTNCPSKKVINLWSQTCHSHTKSSTGLHGNGFIVSQLNSIPVLSMGLSNTLTTLSPNLYLNKPFNYHRKPVKLIFFYH